MRLPRIVPVFACALAAGPALADLTVDQAWANWRAQVAALGLTLDATETQDGDALQIGDLRLTGTLPEGVGSFYVLGVGPRFEPLGDGRVRVVYPDSAQVRLGGAITGEGSAGFTLDWQQNGWAQTMSGAPDRVVSDMAFDAVTLTLGQVMLNGEPAEGGRFDLVLTAGRARVITEPGESHLQIDTETAIGEYAVDYELAVAGPKGGEMRAHTTVRGLTGTQTLVLPRTGIDPLGLHDQLRAGLSARAEVRATGFSSVQRTDQKGTPNGDITIDQTIEASDYLVAATLDATGFDEMASIGHFDMSMRIPQPPLPLGIAGEGIEARLLVPLLMGEGQDAGFRLALREFTLGEEVWSLFDPEAKLPRDPMTAVVDLGSKVALMFEVLDIRKIIAGTRPPPLPVMAKSATLNELTLSGLGAELTGQGDVTFDYTDWTTFPGMPAPDGKARLQFKGVHGLLDRLIDMGILPDEHALSIRMTMALISRAGEGDDVATSDIEVRKTGEVFANGQRVK